MQSQLLTHPSLSSRRAGLANGWRASLLSDQDKDATRGRPLDYLRTYAVANTDVHAIYSYTLVPPFTSYSVGVHFRPTQYRANRPSRKWPWRMPSGRCRANSSIACCTPNRSRSIR